eukprot:1620924-Amphidinium_carterae.1
MTAICAVVRKLMRLMRCMHLKTKTMNKPTSASRKQRTCCRVARSRQGQGGNATSRGKAAARNSTIT